MGLPNHTALLATKALLPAHAMLGASPVVALCDKPPPANMNSERHICPKLEGPICGGSSVSTVKAGDLHAGSAAPHLWKLAPPLRSGWW